MKKCFALGFMVLLILCFASCGKSSIINENNSAFAKSVKGITTDEIALNDITAFDWDTVYTFSPYTSKESIEEIIGFESNSIEETVSESMTQLLFVKGEEVVCSICGYGNNLGYGFSFGAYDGDYIAISDNDNAIFTVISSNGIIYLIYNRQEENIKWDRRPMIMIEDSIYMDTGNEVSVEVDDTAILGTIISAVDGSELPTENNQSNFGCEGSEYAYYENGIIIKINEKWFFFEKETQTE